MAIVEVAILYAACGLGCAAAVLSHKPRRVSDALLMLPLWPLFAPFVFVTGERGGGEGLSGLLPTAETVAPLRSRLEVARSRLGEIDAMLAKPSFDSVALEARLSALEAGGGSPLALVSARSRQRSIERLVARRKMLATELEELAELFLQLETQTEVVRLAGSADDSVSDLVADIQSRLEGIDELENEASYLS